MPNKAQSKITPQDIARYGHIATLLRAEMEKRQWGPRDLAEHMGIGRNSTSVYPWLKGTGQPGKQARAMLVKTLGLPETALMAREIGDPVPVATTSGAVVLAPQARPQAARGGDVLGFTVSATGEARIRLDVSMPLEQAKALFRMILDAGIVFGEGEG